MTSPIETRSFEAVPKAGDQRIIAGIAVPFGSLDEIRDDSSSFRGRFMERWHRGALTRSIAERGHKVRALWSHDQRSVPIGKILSFDEREDGLWVEIRISETPRGDELLTLVRDGAVDGFSVSFSPKRVDESGKHAATGLPIREIREAALIEISLVNFPALDRARVTESRSAHPLVLKEEMNMSKHTEEAARLTEERAALVGPDGVIPTDSVERYDDLTAQIERSENLEQIRVAALDPRNLEPGVAPPIVGARDPIGDPFYRSGWTESETKTRQRADAAIERAFSDADSAQAATDTLNDFKAGESRDAAEHIIATSDPAYQSAFRKHMLDPESGYQTFSGDEREAWGRVRDLSQRTAFGLSGAVLPSLLDPTIALTNAGTIDPIRGLARVGKTTTNSKRFITSAGVTASWDGEIAEVSDDTPTLTEVEIRAEKAQGFVQASIEAAMDQPNWDQEVVRMFADAKARLEGAGWINGTDHANNQPMGLWTAINGEAGEITPTSSETFAAADVYKVLQAVTPRFRQNAAWMAELSTLNLIDQFETTNGSKLFEDPYTKLLGKPVYENSNVAAASAINTGATADNPIIFVGDFSTYGVVDRLGMTIEHIPHLFNANAGLPDGRRGWYAFWRVGGAPIEAPGIVVLNIATAE